MRNKIGRTGRKCFLPCLAAVIVCVLSGCADAAPSGVKIRTPNSGAAESVKETGNRLESVQAARELKIGISADYAPFAFVDDSGAQTDVPYAGADVELGKYIAGQLGVAADFCEMEFEACMDAVEDGSVDLVLLGMFPKEERAAKMDFTDVYYRPGRQMLLVRRSDKDNYQTADDFVGKTLCAQYGSLQAQLIAEQFPESCLELADNLERAASMLRTESVDAVAADEIPGQKILDEFSSLADSGISLEYEGEGVVGGVAKGEPELLKAVNAAIAQEKAEGLYYQWIDAANEQAAALSGTANGE